MLASKVKGISQPTHRPGVQIDRLGKAADDPLLQFIVVLRGLRFAGMYATTSLRNFEGECIDLDAKTGI